MSELFVSIPKQQQMMTQPMASVKFIKAKVIFSYHTKGVSNQVLSNSDHEVKFFSKFQDQNGKKRKSGTAFSGLQNGAIRSWQIWAGLQITHWSKKITNQGKDSSNRDKRDFKP